MYGAFATSKEKPREYWNEEAHVKHLILNHSFFFVMAKHYFGFLSQAYVDFDIPSLNFGSSCFTSIYHTVTALDHLPYSLSSHSSALLSCTRDVPSRTHCVYMTQAHTHTHTHKHVHSLAYSDGASQDIRIYIYTFFRKHFLPASTRLVQSQSGLDFLETHASVTICLCRQNLCVIFTFPAIFNTKINF